MSNPGPHRRPSEGEREPIIDYIVLGLPTGVDPDAPDVSERLDEMAELSAMGQYKQDRPRALVMDKVKWLITSDWRDVEAFQPAHDCVACRVGNDQAVAFLKEHPDQRLALGNMRYWEIW